MRLTEDPILINSILKHPDIAPGLFREAGGFKPLPDRILKLVSDEGLFLLEPGNGFVGIHAAIKPECRGIKAIQAAQSAFQWVFHNLGAQAVRARIESDRPEVQRFAVSAGMKRYAVSETHTFYEVRPCH